MAEITDEAKKLCADMANKVRRERGFSAIWTVSDFETVTFFLNVAFARLATEHLALKAKHEKALEDLREIDRIAVNRGWSGGFPSSPGSQIATIAAEYRVETDPLVDLARAALQPIWMKCTPSREDAIAAVAAELKKRGIEIEGAKATDGEG